MASPTSQMSKPWKARCQMYDKFVACIYRSNTTVQQKGSNIKSKTTEETPKVLRD